MAMPIDDSESSRPAEAVGSARSEESERLFIADGVSEERAWEIFSVVTSYTHAHPEIGEQLEWVQARTLEKLPKVKIRLQDHYTKNGNPFRSVSLAWSEGENVRRQVMLCIESDDTGALRITHPDGAMFQRLDDEEAEGNVRMYQEWVKERQKSLEASGSSVEEELEWFRYKPVLDQPSDVGADLESFLNTLRDLDVTMVHSTQQARPASGRK